MAIGTGLKHLQISFDAHAQLFGVAFGIVRLQVQGGHAEGLLDEFSHPDGFDSSNIFFLPSQLVSPIIMSEKRTDVAHGESETAVAKKKARMAKRRKKCEWCEGKLEAKC